ncbi:MAG TPA: hypothetical protein VF456_10220 [Vicinamibacterales bacterium]
MRRCFFGSVLLAAIAAIPMACAFVLFEGAQIDVTGGPEAVHAAALALMRTFIVSFDISVMTMWLPCAFYLSRLKRSRGTP